MRTIILLAATLLGCDVDTGRRGAVVEPVECNVCIVDLTDRSVSLEPCPGEVTDGECLYLGCSVACLPDAHECTRGTLCTD